MKKTNRMIKTALVILLILASMLCFAACGSSTPSVDSASGAAGNLTWSYDKDTKTLTVTGVGEMPNAASSSEVAWAEVREGVETIVVREGITTVGDYAFYYMPYAKSVSLPTSLTSIGKYAFGFCSALESVSIPESVTALGDSAFEACSALKSIVVSPNVTSIGARAFALCSSMTDATVVATVTELRAETFYGCRSLTNLILHTGIAAENVHETAFASCPKTFADAERRDTVEGNYEIVITYVYEDGTPAAPTVREEKQNGTAYAYTTPVLEGYTADKAEITGTLNGAGVNETVTYKKNAETEPAETTPAETTVAEPEEEQSKTELIVSVVVLVVVVIGIAVAAFLLLRNNKKNTSKNNKTAQNKNKKK